MSEAHVVTLHDRATRGEPLSNEEEATLEAWYAQQDQGESAVLTHATPAFGIPELQSQLDTSLRQLEVVTQHIREAVAVNNDLRREIGQLQRQLAQLPSDRAA